MEERENFCRICGILLNVGGKVLRETFMDKNVGTVGFVAYLSNSSRKKCLSGLLKAKTLRQKQFDLLYPSNGILPSIELLDITLLCLLFQNLDTKKKPSDSVWKNPLQSDVSYQADVTRIRQIRNTLFGHAEYTAVSNIIYSSEINNLTTIYKQLVQNLSPGKMSMDDLEVLIESELNGPLQKDLDNEVQRLREEIEDLHKHNVMLDFEGKYFYCLSKLILDAGTHTLQCLFEKQYLASCGYDLQQFLNSKKAEIVALSEGNIIKQDEKDLLLPSTGCEPLLEDLPISLLTTLLIHLCGIQSPICGWTKSPGVGDKSPGADILRICHAKENLASHPKCGIAATKFHQEWFIVKEAISRLSSQLIKDQQDDIERKIEEAKQANTDSDWVKQIAFCIFKEICKNSQKLQRPNNSDTGSPNIILPKELLDEDEEQINEDIKMPQGEEGIICIIKSYAILKSEVEKETAMHIARKLFKEKNSKDVLEEMDKAETRRLCVDHLLKRVLENTTVLQPFLNLLKVKRLEQIAKILEENEVTEEDRRKFKQVNEQAEKMEKAPCRLRNGCKIEETDIKFFRGRLLHRSELIDEINDVLLSQFHISIMDHSKVSLCLNREEKMCVLFKALQSCNFHSDSELQVVLGSSLYKEWKQSKDKSSGQGQDNPDILHSILQRILRIPREMVENLFEKFGIHFSSGRPGSVILKFLAGDNFDVKLLKPEPLKKTLRDLIRIACPEYLVRLKEPVRVTLFFKPPRNTDTAEIYFHLETSLEIKGKEEGSVEKLDKYDRDYMTEKMDPTSLREWMFRKLMLDRETKSELINLVFWKDMWTREKMKLLLSTIESLENGYKLLQKYCEERNTVVYNNVFKRKRQLNLEENPKAGLLSGFSCEEGEELQVRFSTWMDFTVDPEEGSVEKLENHDKDYMTEEMDPTSLREWMFKKLELHREKEIQLMDLVSWKDMSRREKMKLLLSTIESLENGYKLLQNYCEEKNTVVYNNVFKRKRQLNLEENPKAGLLSEFLCEEGEELQMRFSTWMDFTVDPEALKGTVGPDPEETQKPAKVERLKAITSQSQTEIAECAADMQQLLREDEKHHMQETVQQLEPKKREICALKELRKKILENLPEEERERFEEKFTTEAAN